MKKNVFIYLLLMFCTLWITSCNSSDNPVEDGEETADYVTFSTDSPMTFVIWYVGEVPAKIEYSLNEGEWITYTKGEILDFGGLHGTLRLRGRNSFGTCLDERNYLHFIVDAPEGTFFRVSGDIRTLVDWKNYQSADTSEARFCSLFTGCGRMISAPALPAMQLATECYESMFRNCYSLVEAPELPAIQLAEACYSGMFKHCYSLLETPVLPAIEAPDNCYAGMFWSCTGLKKVNLIAAKSLGVNACGHMFRYCRNLVTALDFSFEKLSEYCCASMFWECNSLTAIPDVFPAKELKKYCYKSMFFECYNLEKSPVLPAEVLVEGCYDSMFENGHPSEVTMLAHHVEENNLRKWLKPYGSSIPGVLKKSPHMSLEELKNANAVPEGWTVVDYEF